METMELRQAQHSRTVPEHQTRVKCSFPLPDAVQGTAGSVRSVVPPQHPCWPRVHDSLIPGPREESEVRRREGSHCHWPVCPSLCAHAKARGCYMFGFVWFGKFGSSLWKLSARSPSCSVTSWCHGILTAIKWVQTLQSILPLSAGAQIPLSYHCVKFFFLLL